MGVLLAVVWNDAEQTLLEHIGLAFLLSFVIGFEREVRGAPVGDGTYALPSSPGSSGLTPAATPATTTT